MNQDRVKFIPVNDEIGKGRGEHHDSTNKISLESSTNDFDFVYFEPENEWLQEYELIYNSYRIEK